MEEKLNKLLESKKVLDALTVIDEYVKENDIHVEIPYVCLAHCVEHDYYDIKMKIMANC